MISENSILDLFQYDTNNNNTMQHDPDANYFNNCKISANKYYLSNEFTYHVDRLASKGNMSLLHVNIRSLRNKFDSFLDYINLLNYPFSIIALTETWLNNNDTEYYVIPGYKLITVNRDGRLGGGVCMYVRNNIDFKLRNDLTMDSSIAECLFIEIINSNSKNSLTGVIYRAPNNKYDEFDSKLTDLLTAIDKEGKICYLLGDFNIDLLKYKHCNNSSNFLNQMISSMLVPTINRPTRITNSSATLIDNIFTNKPTNYFSGILLNDLSDHLPIFLIDHNNPIKVKNDKNVTLRRRITEDNLKAFSEALDKVNWNNLKKFNDPNELYNEFLKTFTHLYDKHFPLKKVSKAHLNRSDNPWISNGIVKSIKNKHRLYKKFLSKPTQTNESKYKIYRNKLNHTIRIAKKLYFHKKLTSDQGNTKETWRTLNELLNRKNNTHSFPSKFVVDQKELTDPSDIANNFNDFFVNIGPKLAEKFDKSNDMYNNYLTGDYLNSMFLSEITPSEVV